MTSPLAPDALRAAAYRLKHDVGKAIRWGAPAESERDAEAMRARLRADLLEARRESERPISVSELFKRWQRDEASAFEGSPLADEVAALAREMEEISRRAARLGDLDEEGLRALDGATRRVAEACARLHRAAVEAGR